MNEVLISPCLIQTIYIHMFAAMSNTLSNICTMLSVSSHLLPRLRPDLKVFRYTTLTGPEAYEDSVFTSHFATDWNNRPMLLPLVLDDF